MDSSCAWVSYVSSSRRIMLCLLYGALYVCQQIPCTIIRRFNIIRTSNYVCWQPFLISHKGLITCLARPFGSVCLSLSFIVLLFRADFNSKTKKTQNNQNMRKHFPELVCWFSVQVSNVKITDLFLLSTPDTRQLDGWPHIMSALGADIFVRSALQQMSVIDLILCHSSVLLPQDFRLLLSLRSCFVSL